MAEHARENTLDIHELKTKAEAGDVEAQYRLAVCFATGDGTAVDPLAAATNALAASVAGSDEARRFIADQLVKLGPEIWQQAMANLQWPDLLIALGPPVPDGNPPPVIDAYTQFATAGDWETSDWLERERETAEAYLVGKDSSESTLSAAYGAPVWVNTFNIAFAVIRGRRVAVVAISLSQIRTKDGLVAYWPPMPEGLKALCATIRMLETREWVEWRCAAIRPDA
jgi:hypothetical protein